MVILYFEDTPIVCYPSIAVQLGYRAGDQVATKEKVMELVDANAIYYQLLCQAQQQSGN